MKYRLLLSRRIRDERYTKTRTVVMCGTSSTCFGSIASCPGPIAATQSHASQFPPLPHR